MYDQYLGRNHYGISRSSGLEFNWRWIWFQSKLLDLDRFESNLEYGFIWPISRMSGIMIEIHAA